MIKPIAAKYVPELSLLLPNASIAEIHSEIMHCAALAIKNISSIKKCPEELIKFG